MTVNGNSKNEHQLDTHHGVDIDMCHMNVRSEPVINNIQQYLQTKHQQSQSQLRYMNVCVINCCSIRNKLTYVLDHVNEHNSDIVAITESWLSSEDSNNRTVSQECAQYDYKLFHVPRPNRRGGGVALLIKRGLNVITQAHSIRQSFEHVELLVTAISIHLRIVVIYRPPQSTLNKMSKSQFIDDFSEYLEALSASSGRLLICGDFNINWADSNDNICKKLFNILEAFNLQQHIKNSTHKSGHLLDYIISDGQLINSVSVSDFISDHCALHATIACTRDHPGQKKITYRCMKNIDSDQLSADISKIDFKTDCDNVDIVVDNYDTVLASLLDLHAPLKTNNVICRDLQPWMSEEILSVKREKRKSERIWRKTKLTVHLEIFRALCLKLKTLIHVAKEKCFKKQISDCGGDQKQLFGIVNSILGRGKQIVYPRHTDSLTLASLFNNYFITKIADIRKEFPGLELDAAQMSTPDFNVHNSHATLSDFTPTTNDEVQQLLSRMNKTTCKLDPFCTAIIMQHSLYFIHVYVHIINLCLSSGIFPTRFKSAVVKPLIKKPTLDCEVLKNFRPISNLPFLSKLIEKVIAERLVSHMQDNGIVEKYQSAYKANHSTETALLRVYNDLLISIDQGGGATLVLLDLSSAFDTIDHAVLFDLWQDTFGISGTALSLLKSYLHGRTQCVQIEGIISEYAKLVCGVPQGSVLGPLNFCFYMYPLGSILRHHCINYHIYADDTQLYITFDLSDPSIAIEKLNLCISDIRTWMIKNKLKINDSKTEFLVLTSSFYKQQFNDLQINVGNTQIKPTASARNLGVIFDRHLNLESHINNVCRSAYFHLRNIGSVRNMLSDDACSQLIHALVTVRIDYCNSLLYGLPEYSLDRLQKILNTAARILRRVPKFDHISETLMDLHWLPVHQRVTFKILILTYQAYHETAPHYLCDLIVPYANTCNLRSNNMLLIAPCHPRAKLKTYGERSFQHAAPKEWNNLPLVIRDSPSLAIFKSRLKTFLFRSAFSL